MGGGLYDTRSDTGAAVLGRSPRGGGSVGRPGGDPMDQYCCPLHGGGGGRPAGTPAGLPAGVAVLHGLCPPGGDGIPGTGRLPAGGYGRRDRMGCSTSCCPPAGAGAWDLRLRRRHCGAWNGWHRPWCWQTRWQRIPPASEFWSGWALSAPPSTTGLSAGRGGCWISGTTPAAGLVRRRPSDRDGPVQHEEMRNVHEQKTAAVRL